MVLCSIMSDNLRLTKQEENIIEARPRSPLAAIKLSGFELLCERQTPRMEFLTPLLSFRVLL